VLVLAPGERASLAAVTGWRLWLAGARPRTLPAAIVPVAVGTASASDHGTTWWRAACALVVSLALQVGVNYANDYSDGVRGTDEARVGPVRLVGSGLVSPSAVERAAFAAFGVACVAGLALAAVTSWWLIAIGAAAVAAAWFYTGGPRPYGYAGLGELFVFVFFGVVATAGSAYVQTESVEGLHLLASIPVGLLATALLVTNNLRDIPTDRTAGKRTLAVRLGDQATRWLYVALAVGALVTSLATVPERPWSLLGVAAAGLAVVPVRTVVGGATGRALISVLAGTGRLQLVFGALYAAGLWVNSG
jgi:1,4-dihydroxy-2-naphthoate octaprenyltransferase